MTDSTERHQYQIGDAVLADCRGVRVPGVIEDEEGGQFRVRLSEPWVDETGQSSDSVLLPASSLDPSLEQETGGTELLPG